jgi:hypothetical protein
MPMKLAHYPKHWPAISKRIRARSGGRCECSGQCGRHLGKRCPAMVALPHPVTGSRVILSAAHLDHSTGEVSDSMLAAMCQWCHLRYDLKQRLLTRLYNRTKQMFPKEEFPL